MRQSSFQLLILLLCASAASGQTVIRRFSGSSGGPPDTVQAIVESPMIGSVPSFAFFANRFMPSDPIGMLQQRQIQEELELSEDQIAVVQELQKDIQRQSQEIFAKGAEFGGDAARLMESAHKAIREGVEKELKNVLSPKQLARLSQLEVQMSIRNRGVRALTEDKLAKALEVSDDQKLTIRREQRDAMRDLEKEIAKLRDRYRKRLIRDLLSDEQLRKLQALSGEEYEVQEINPRRSGR